MLRYATAVAAVTLVSLTCLAATAPILQESHQDTVGRVPLRITSGDLNADNQPDIVVSNSSTQDISIFFNTGEATFGPELRLPAGGDVRETVIADLDGDGDNDLVALLRQADSSIVVWLAAGPGVFGPAQFYGGPATTTFSLELTDINNDDRLDAVFVEGFIDSKLMMLLNNGAGAFSHHADLVFDDAADFSYVFDIASGDINGDGRDDMVIASLLSDLLFVAHGIPGGFSEPVSIRLQGGGFTIGKGVASVAVGDADNDGDLDVFMFQQNGTELDSLRIARNNGGVLTALPEAVAVEVSDSFTKPFAITLADLNGDDRLDVVTTSPRANVAPVIINGGGLQFEIADELPTESGPVSAVADDFDGDGDTDVAVVALDQLIAPGRFHVYRNLMCALGQGDVNGSGAVNIDDLLLVIGNWGVCPATPECPGDANQSGIVDVDDLLTVILGWGPCS